MAYMAEKENVGKMAIFEKKNGLTPLKKYQFLDCLNLLFF